MEPRDIAVLLLVLLAAAHAPVLLVNVKKLFLIPIYCYFFF